MVRPQYNTLLDKFNRTTRSVLRNSDQLSRARQTVHHNDVVGVPACEQYLICSKDVVKCFDFQTLIVDLL
jgi:hypothetical protein